MHVEVIRGQGKAAIVVGVFAPVQEYETAETYWDLRFLRKRVCSEMGAASSPLYV